MEGPPEKADDVAGKVAESSVAQQAQDDEERQKAERMMADTRQGDADFHGTNEAFFERESTEDRERGIEDLKAMGLSMEDIRDAKFEWTWRDNSKGELVDRDNQIEGDVAGKHIEVYRERLAFDGKYYAHAIVDGVALEGDEAKRYMDMMQAVARSQTHPSEGRKASDILK